MKLMGTKTIHYNKNEKYKASKRSNPLCLLSTRQV